MSSKATKIIRDHTKKRHSYLLAKPRCVQNHQATGRPPGINSLPIEVAHLILRHLYRSILATSPTTAQADINAWRFRVVPVLFKNDVATQTKWNISAEKLLLYDVDIGLSDTGYLRLMMYDDPIASCY